MPHAAPSPIRVWLCVLLLPLLLASAWATASPLVVEGGIVEPYVTQRTVPMFQRVDLPGALATPEDLEPFQTLWGTLSTGGEWLVVVHRASDVDTRRAVVRRCSGLALREPRPDGEVNTWIERPAPVRMVGVDAGRVTTDDLVRSCSRVIGYVRRADVVPAAQLDVAGLPFELSAIGTRVPRLWDRFGVDDPRVLVAQHDRHPFDAIAYFENGVEGMPGKARSCTAFFVGPDTLVTARHCVRHAQGSKRVVIRRAPSRMEAIDVDVVAAGQSSDDRALDTGDWVLLKARRRPRLPVGVLSFATGLPSEHAVMDAMLVGYPRDLGYLVGRGQLRPITATPCRLTARSITAHGDGTDRGLEVRARTRTCMSWHGNSGGPLLVWNAQAARFEVLAVTSAGFNLAALEDSGLRPAVDAIVAPLSGALLAAAREVAERVGSRTALPDSAMAVLRDERFPGVASVAMTLLGTQLEERVFGHDASEYFINASLMRRAVAHHAQPPASPRSRPR